MSWQAFNEDCAMNNDIRTADERRSTRMLIGEYRRICVYLRSSAVPDIDAFVCRSGAWNV